MLVLENLKHTYESDPISYPNWEVGKGRHSLILGNSGSGKTTLLHLIGGLMKPTEGKLTIDGEEIGSKTGNQLDRFRSQNIGIIFQRPHLVRSLSVQENVLLAQLLGKRKTSLNNVKEILGRLGILDLKNRRIHQISQGQAQRVSIARALINEPKLLLADEPTASLDDENCNLVTDLLKTQAEETGATLIVATHDHRVKTAFENKLEL